MYPTGRPFPPYRGNSNVQNSGTNSKSTDSSNSGETSQQGLLVNEEPLVPTMVTVNVPKVPYNSGRQLPPTPIPNQKVEGNQTNQANQSAQINQPIQNTNNVSDETPPPRPTSSIPNGGVSSVQRPSDNQPNQLHQPNSNTTNIGVGSPPVRPRTGSEHLPEVTSKRSLSSSNRNVINNNGSTAGDGQSAYPENVDTRTAPIRPSNLSYAQQPVISNVHRSGTSTPPQPQRPNNNSYESLTNSSNSLPNRSSSSRTPNVTNNNNNGSVSNGDQSNRSNGLGSSVRSFVSSEIFKLDEISSRKSSSKKSSSNKSTSNINYSNDSISENGSQPRITQQPPPEFKKVYPCLAQHEDLQKFTSVEQVENHLKTLSVSALSIFKDIQAVQYLFSCTGIDQPEWEQIDKDLKSAIENIENCFRKINELHANDEKTKNLLVYLGKEVSRQLEYLHDKKTEIHVARNSDPFSEKGIAHYGVVCSNQIEELFNAALADVIKVKKEKHDKKNTSDALKEYGVFDEYDSTNLEQLFDRYRLAIKKFQEKKQQQYEQARSNVRFDIPQGDSPAKVGERLVQKEKKEALQFLAVILKNIGFKDFEIKKFIKGIEVKNAQRLVLNKQEPKDEKRRIVTSLNGVVGRFDIEAIYDKNWKSSTDKSADGFPRNFKVHRLYMIKDDGERVLLRNFVGHGVLDAWAEKDSDKRIEANKNAGIKVVQKAMESNPRVIEICDQGHTPKIDHVSLLLVTPTPLPDVSLDILADSREKMYLLGQFKAFGDIIQEAKEKNLFTVNGMLPDVEICAFGFGTNDLATGENKSKITGGWGYVKEQNDKSMQHLFGNNFGIHEQGKMPGGLIGEVINEIKASSRLTSDQIQSHLIGLINLTDSILKMYLNEDYKYSNGDPIKMNRELEELVSTANEALAAIGSRRVITLSKGCKSDKDRGGITAAEIMHNAIRKALGLPRLVYNQPLSEEEEDLYVAIAALFSDNQQLNTGLRGNKADGRMLPLKKQAYVDGLEKSAKG